MRITVGIAAALVASSTAFAADEKPGEKVTYQDHVQPIFRQHCFSCHNTDRKVGGLDLTSYINMMQGGSSGTVIEAGDAASSYLFMLVNHDSEPAMPPNQDKIPSPQLAVISKWIDGGALENSGSKPIARKKKADLALVSVSVGKPDGPPPMPNKLVLEPVVHTAQTTAVTALATNPWSPLVAIGGQKQVVLYDAQTLSLVGILPFPEGEPKVLQFSRNGSLLLAGGGKGAFSGKVVLWNVRTGERIVEVGDELDSVLAADISADQTLVALGGPQKIVRVYSTEDGSLKYEIKKHTDWITSVAFSPDGVLLATGDRNGGVLAWEAATGREYLSLDGHKGCITDIAWRSDSNLVGSASEDGQVRLWEVMDGKNVKTWTAHGGGVQSVEFCRDGRLVTAGRDKVAKLWDQEGKQVRSFPAFSDIALSVTYSDDASRVIAGDWTGQVKVWSAEDGKEVGELTANPPTLEERLQAAQATLTTRNVELGKLKETATAASAVVTKVQESLAQAQKTVTEMQAKVDASNKMATDLQAAAVTMKQEAEAAQKVASDLEPVVTPLTEAVAKTQQALEKAPADKELASSFANLKQQLDAKTAALTTSKTTVTEKSAAMQKATTDAAAATKTAQEAAVAVEAAKKSIADLTPQVQPLTAKATEAQVAVDAASKLVAEVTGEVTRWQTEIQFRDEQKKLVAAKTQTAEAVAQSEQSAADLQQIQAKLTAAQQKLADTQKGMAAMEAALPAAKLVVTQTTATATAAGQTVATLGALVKSVESALAATTTTLAQAPEDPALKELVVKAQAVLADKQQALQTAQQQQAQADEAAKKAQEAVQTSEAKLKELAASLPELQKAIEATTAEVKTAEAKATTAKTAAEQAQATQQAIQQRVDELIKTIPPQAEVAAK